MIFGDCSQPMKPGAMQHHLHVCVHQTECCMPIFNVQGSAGAAGGTQERLSDQAGKRSPPQGPGASGGGSWETATRCTCVCLAGTGKGNSGVPRWRSLQARSSVPLAPYKSTCTPSTCTAQSIAHRPSQTSRRDSSLALHASTRLRAPSLGWPLPTNPHSACPVTPPPWLPPGP